MIAYPHSTSKPNQTSGSLFTEVITYFKYINLKYTNTYSKKQYVYFGDKI